MKVLVLTQYYAPEPVPIPRAVAQDLAAAGHEVRVLTGFPNYPAGEIYDGFEQQWRKSDRDGLVQVLRVPLVADHSVNACRRMLNYASFAFSSTSARSFARGADVIYVYATQMSAAFGPWLWSFAPGARPYVVHVQDLWPDSITGSSIAGGGFVSRLVSAVLNPWLRSVYKRAAGVAGIAPTMVETLVERGSPPSRTHIVYNWAEEASGIAPRSVATDTTRLLYAGNVGDMQDLETVIEAVHRVRDCDVHLTVVGDGVALPRVHALAEDLGCSNVEFVGRVPAEAMPDFYESADFALITLKDLPLFRGTVPSKLQAALAHGVPVITTVQGDVRRIVDESQAGMAADAESVDSLEQALRLAAGTDSAARILMGKRAQEIYATRFSRSAGIRNIERILSDALGPSAFTQTGDR